MAATTRLADDPTVVQRVLDHIDHETTDRSQASWREPVANYQSVERWAQERAVLRRMPIAFCPSAALPEVGSFIAREAGGTPLLAVRGSDHRVRVFRNACRHRGVQVGSGSGCQRAFVCRYHGWTYGLDGSLKHVPHEDGFPGLEKVSRGLVAVEAIEAQGLVFVDQEAQAGAPLSQPELPPLIAPRYRLRSAREFELAVNWKILVEGFLEGYHIRATHAQTFYPVQFDNLNVVEQFGPNNRITFPYRAIHKLRGQPAAEQNVEGKLTYVYHLFPNVMVATFPGRIIVVVMEPEAVDRTRQITYVLSDREESDVRPEARRRSRRRGGRRGSRGRLRDPAQPRERRQRVLRVRPVRGGDRALSSQPARGAGRGGVSARRPRRERARAPESPADTRSRLILATRALLEEGGYAAASVLAVAKRAGVSAGALYRHFPSKAELVAEVFRDASRRDLAAVDEAATPGGCLERFEAAIATHAKRALRRRRLAWALVHEPVDPAVDAERLRFRREYCRRMAGLLRQAIAAGELPEQNVELVAAAVVGAIAESLVGPLSPSVLRVPEQEALIASLVRFCRRAVGAPDRAALRRVASD